MKIDVAELRKSPLFAKYRVMVRDLLVAGFADCRYDPFDDIASITAGIPAASDLGVFVVRGLDRDKTLECLRTSKIETETEAIFDGDLVELRNKSGSTNLLKFVDARNAVLQGSKGPTRASLEKALLVGAPLRANTAFVAAERTLKPGAAVSMIGRPGSQAMSQMVQQRIGAPVVGFAATVHVTNVVAIHVVIEMAEASTAEAMVENMRPNLEALRQFFGRYDLRAEQRTVLVDMEMTEDQIEKLAAMIKAMMPK